MSSPEYVYWVNPTCNHSTAVGAYTTTRVALDVVMLWRVEFRIPPGHAGLTGIALVDSGSFVVPYSPGAPAWLIGDDDLLSYDYGRELGKNCQLATYNTDTTNNHGWQVRLVYSPMSVVEEDQATIVVNP